MSILGLDVGTSTCKGIVLSDEGRVIAQQQIPYADAVHTAGPSSELDPGCFEKSVKQIISSLAGKTAQDPIRAISVSTHGETLIPIGRDGKPLCGAILSMDRRSQAYSDRLVEMLGQEAIYGITGSMMHPQFPVPKVMWLQQEQGKLAAAVAHYDTANDYVCRILGCPGVMDQSIASRFGGFDTGKRAWSDTILHAAGVDPALFSKTVQGGTVIGPLPVSLCRELGLTGQVLLVAGGHDQPCAAVGMGCGRKGTVTVSAGSYECAVLTAPAPLNGAAGFRYGLNSYCHVLPDQYATLAFFVSGMMAKWYLDTFCGGKEAGSAIFQRMEPLLKRRNTGICVTPHIYGAMNPEWSEHASAKISGLTAGATAADLYQAVLEGTCCELDLNLQILEALTEPIHTLIMSGGGTRSPFWMQLRADITGKTVCAMEGTAEASCLGAAILAGVGAGVFENPSAAPVERRLRTYIPQDTQRYAGQKRDFLALHEPGLLEGLRV